MGLKEVKNIKISFSFIANSINFPFFWYFGYKTPIFRIKNVRKALIFHCKTTKFGKPTFCKKSGNFRRLKDEILTKNPDGNLTFSNKFRWPGQISCRENKNANRERPGYSEWCRVFCRKMATFRRYSAKFCR